MRNRVWTATAAGLLLLGLGGSASADGTLIGNVAAADPDAKTFTVEETGASQATTFKVDGKTRIRQGRKQMDFSTLQPGRGVRVKYEGEGDAAVARDIDLSLPTGAGNQ
ncbi:MAG: hypothetical protein DCC71_16005 [Proteobacteria bacterium]|nr:MAG: hypothetical protein DCC71_16005 [Pseudomonadota bacterium]